MIGFKRSCSTILQKMFYFVYLWFSYILFKKIYFHSYYNKILKEGYRVVVVKYNMSFSYIDDDEDICFSKVNNSYEWIQTHTTREGITNNLICIELNIRTICRYWDLIHVYFKNCIKHIDIIMLYEFATRSELLCLYDIPGYNMF